MATAIAWLLNLDADSELGDPARYRRPPALEMRMAELRSRLRVLAPQDRVLGADADPSGCERALAFCPTPSASTQIRRYGLAPPRAPSLDVLRRVNGRRFCAELGQTLPLARFVDSFEELESALSSGAPEAVWLLKRPYSFAGRERRRAVGRELDRPTLGFAQRSFERGEGLQVEPLLDRTADFALHGYVLEDGRLVFAAISRQRCDPRGGFIDCAEAAPDDLFDDERAALAESAREAGEALHAAGYFGPFGVDAFRYRAVDGGRAFQPRSEINARFSMGYPRALLEQALTLEGEPRR